jgi:hypothetical protein
MVAAASVCLFASIPHLKGEMRAPVFGTAEEQQIPPLRFTSVGMTIDVRRKPTSQRRDVGTRVVALRIFTPPTLRFAQDGAPAKEQIPPLRFALVEMTTLDRD